MLFTRFRNIYRRHLSNRHHNHVNFEFVPHADGHTDQPFNRDTRTHPTTDNQTVVHLILNETNGINLVAVENSINEQNSPNHGRKHGCISRIPDILPKHQRKRLASSIILIPYLNKRRK